MLKIYSGLWIGSRCVHAEIIRLFTCTAKVITQKVYNVTNCRVIVESSLKLITYACILSDIMYSHTLFTRKGTLNCLVHAGF